jgi:hypothetical protein
MRPELLWIKKARVIIGPRSIRYAFGNWRARYSKPPESALAVDRRDPPEHLWPRCAFNRTWSGIKKPCPSRVALTFFRAKQESAVTGRARVTALRFRQGEAGQKRSGGRPGEEIHQHRSGWRMADRHRAFVTSTGKVKQSDGQTLVCPSGLTNNSFPD